MGDLAGLFVDGAEPDVADATTGGLGRFPADNPFGEGDAVGVIEVFVESGTADGFRGFEAVEVEVVDRATPAGVFVEEGEGGRVDASRGTDATDESADEGGLAGSEIPAESVDGTGGGVATEVFTELLGFLGGVGEDGGHGPAASVSEVFVAAGREFAHAVAVADEGGRAVGDAADAGEAHIREAFAPAIHDGDGIACGDGEEKFEVFAVGEGGDHGGFGEFAFPGAKLCGAADGDGGTEEFGTEIAAHFKEVSEITREAIADVDHGVDLSGGGEPLALGEAGFELEVASGDGSAEFTGDEDGVADPGPGAAEALVAGDASEERDGHEDLAGIGGGLPADDGHLKACGGAAHATVEGLDPGGVMLRRKPEGDDGRGGLASHGGNVAQGSRHGLVTDFLGVGIGEEVDAFDDGIGLQQGVETGIAKIQHGAVVAGTGDDKVIGGQQRLQPGDQLELVHQVGGG
jgi:hypothetical protein